jgi:hypothetical protein
MGDELARQWVNAAVPSWVYRWLMPVGWLAAMTASVVSAVSGDSALCSASDPSICGPDTAFALAAVACLACLVAWWRMPRIAAVAGLVYLVLELRYDDDATGRLAWIIYGAACVVVLIALTWSNLRRRDLLAAVPRVPVTIPAATPTGPALAWLGAGVLVIAGVVALGVMHLQVKHEDEHVSRAVQQTAVVDAVGDGDIVLKLPDGRRQTVTPTDDYAKGVEIPVLVDPADSSWLRLQAEPADFSLWYTAAGGAWVVALLLLWRDLVRRRARPRRSWTATGLPVWLEPDGSMGFTILPREDSDLVLGFVALDLDDEEAAGRLSAAYDVLEDEGDEVDEDEPRPPMAARREWSNVLHRYRGNALLVGDLTNGSWPTVVIGDQILRPVTPFRSPRRTPWSVEEPGIRLSELSWDDEPSAVPETIVPEPATVLPKLPWRVPLVPPAWWMGPVLIATLVAVPVAVWVVVAVWGEWWLAIAGAGAVGPQVIVLVAATFQRVVVTSTELVIRSETFERTVNWRDVDAVEIEDGDVTLTVADGWSVISNIPQDRLHEAAGVFEAVRRRARGTVPERPAGRRISSGFYLIAVYFGSCVVVLVVQGLM